MCAEARTVRRGGYLSTVWRLLVVVVLVVVLVLLLVMVGMQAGTLVWVVLVLVVLTAVLLLVEVVQAVLSPIDPQAALPNCLPLLLLLVVVVG